MFTPILELVGLDEAAVVGIPFSQKIVSGEGASTMPGKEAVASVRKRPPMSVFALCADSRDLHTARRTKRNSDQCPRNYP